MDKQLKRKITNCWNVITEDQKSNPFLPPTPTSLSAMSYGEKSRAFYQLEYILIEAGLLARRRERRHGGEPMLQPQFDE
jgi:hypothetical protein